MIHWNTKNRSFIDMHFYLKERSVKNNTFFLTLLDPKLEYVDPYDPNLSVEFQARVLKECIFNYWYFLREVIRVPTPGGPKPYEFNPAFSAFHYLSELNCNIYIELPRQIGKTTAAIIRFLYMYQFKAYNSKMLFYHQNHSGSKQNLETLKVIRDTLPVYLQMKSMTDKDGKKVKGVSRAESIKHLKNNNQIITMPGAATREKADKIGRGTTCTGILFDEHAFMSHNDVIYATIAPAFRTAAEISRKSGNPHGIVITTTAGSLNRPESRYSFNIKENAVKWNETMYDMSLEELHRIVKPNDFIYIKYQYYEIGLSRKWLDDIIILLQRDWKKIRREYLLEWEFENNNSPFDSADIELMLASKSDPVSKLYYGSNVVNIYKQFSKDYLNRYPVIIGVDPSSTQARNDSSCFTIIDSKTTSVIGTFNSNYISSTEFANIMVDVVLNHFPNAVVIVETNGGYGDIMIETGKKYFPENLYYEFREDSIEERSSNYSTVKKQVTVKRFGLNSSQKIRNMLIDILYQRVSNHKDKFLCPILIDEISTMEVKSNGKVEHSSCSHDDQVFSYLLALYVWYHGKNLSEFGIQKFEIESDSVKSSTNDEIVEFKLDEENLKERISMNPADLSDFYSQFENDKKQELSNDYTKNTNFKIPKDYLKNDKVLTLENVFMNNNNNFSNNSMQNDNDNISKNSWEI